MLTDETLELHESVHYIREGASRLLISSVSG